MGAAYMQPKHRDATRELHEEEEAFWLSSRNRLNARTQIFLLALSWLLLRDALLEDCLLISFITRRPTLKQWF